jgi:hypothetical protein
MREPTAWDRLRTQFKPDGKGRYKTTDAMKVAVQIDNERIQLLEQMNGNTNAELIKTVKALERELSAYKSHLRSVTSSSNK